MQQMLAADTGSRTRVICPGCIAVGVGGNLGGGKAGTEVGLQTRICCTTGGKMRYLQHFVLGPQVCRSIQLCAVGGRRAGDEDCKTLA
eukprot:751268-Hanusia_phi.AAC.4